MAEDNELVQVTISLCKSHVPLLPEIIKVISTARCSDYLWDSMKLCVKNDTGIEVGSRIVLILNKSLTENSEILSGKIHKCPDQVCKHDSTSNDIVGDFKMTSYTDKTLKEYLKMQRIQEEDEERIQGTGWLEKEVSDEMFFPSWYDNIRRKGVPQLNEENDLMSEIPMPRSTVIVQNVDVFPFLEAKNDCLPFRPRKKEDCEEISRLRKVFDRAKDNHFEEDFFGDCREIREQSPKPEIRNAFRFNELQEVPNTSTSLESSNYVFSNCFGFESDLSAFPHIDNTIKPYQHNHEIYSIRNHNSDHFQLINEDIPPEGTDSSYEGARDRNPSTADVNTKKGILRSYSANMLPKRSNIENHSDDDLDGRVHHKVKRRPKSGPEKKVGFIKERMNDYYEGDNNYRQSSDISLESIKKSLKTEFNVKTLNTNKKEKRRRERHRRLTSHTSFTNNEVLDFDHVGRNIDRSDGALLEGNENKKSERKAERKPSKIFHDDAGVSGKGREKRNKSPREDSEIKLETNRSRKSRADKKVKEEQPIVTNKVEEKKQSKEQPKKESTKEKNNKKPKTPTEEDSLGMGDGLKLASEEEKTSSDDKFEEKEEMEEKSGIIEGSKSWKRGFLLGKRVSPATAAKIEGPQTPSEFEIKPAEKKKDLSFLELLSLMTDEVKQLGRKRDKKGKT